MTTKLYDQIKVALFADSYGQVNGAAMTLGRLVDFAEANVREMLCIYGGKTNSERKRGSVKEISYRQSPLSIEMDDGLAFDPLFLRHFRKIKRELRAFKPDVIHITGLNDVSIAGCIASRYLDIPMIATWHTNVHEFASRRLERLLSFLPGSASGSIAALAERKILDWNIVYHRIPKITLAPNPDLVSLLQTRTGRQARLMTRGVDTAKFSPENRTANDGIFRFGYVGRLRPEKNVSLLIDVASAIPDERRENVRLLIVGDGSEYGLLKDSIPNAELTGFLDGDTLAEAYANIDVFLFPSETDAFGNVVQEANASGVPAIVMAKGGPMFIVENGVNGLVAKDRSEFVAHALRLLNSPSLVTDMKATSRAKALGNSWDSVFDSVYQAYTDCAEMHRSRTQKTVKKKQESINDIQEAEPYAN